MNLCNWYTKNNKMYTSKFNGIIIHPMVIQQHGDHIVGS